MKVLFFPSQTDDYNQLLEKVVTQNWNRLSNFALKKCWYHKQDGEDVLCESLAKALVRVEKVRPKKILSWLFRIIQTTAIDHARKKKKTVNYESVMVSYNTSHTFINKDIVTNILYELAPRDRELMVLKYLEEKTVSEIAAILQLKVNTTTVALTRAINKSKKIASKRYGVQF
jgi:RNA polymerase sigma-70 factor, ECF subfamily